MSASVPELAGGRFDRRRIGLVVPSTNVVMERDLWRMAPAGTSVVTARMTYDRRLPPLQRLEHQLAFVPQALADLASAGVDVVVFGCTSGSFVHGRTWEEAYIERLETLAGRPVILTARALVSAARVAGIERPTVVSPYRREVNDRLVAYLESWGLPVARLVELEGSLPERIEVPAIADALRSASPGQGGGFVVACTALRAWEAAVDIGPSLGVPIVTSNMAALGAALAPIPEP